MNHFLFSLAVFVLLAPFSFLHAQTPCGNIIAPADFYYEGSEAESVPIENCANPFERTHPLTTLRIDGTVATEGTTYQIDADGLETYGFTGDNFYNTDGATYYRKEGTDYVHVKTEFTEPTHEAIVTSITEFFGGTSARETSYREAYFSADTYDFFQSSEGDLYVDAVTGTYVYEVYDEMENYIKAHVQSPRTPLPPGTYTVVRIDTDEGPSESFNTNNPFKHLFASLIPTAHAYYNVETVTFTLVVPQEPTGASSVLFLPGIQASRLYTDGILGTENQIWEPNTNVDVEKLEMTEAGESVNSVYTRDVIDELALPIAGTNVYKGFLGFLEDLKEDKKIIKEYQSFAYDWRFDVIDIAQGGTKYENEIKSLVAEIESLASTSYSHKVTIIGHSNGGLLGKALISELVEQNKQELVDKLVMIGTPQLGTPKAIGVMLHGLGQIAGINGRIVDPKTARDVIRNMPGTYALLPSAEYFAKNDDVLVTSDTSNTTASVRTYGDITTQQQLNNYLLDTQDERGDDVPLYEPSTLNIQLLHQSLATKLALDLWLPPDDIDVYEVVGTGNPTIKGFKYESFPCVVGGVVICSTGVHMDAVPQISDDGDETVMALSAGGQDGVKVQGVVDLQKEKTFLSPFAKTHFNITESPTVQNFLDSIIKYPYISDTLVVPEFVNVSRAYKIIGVHSPVSLSITDTMGKQAGMVDGEVKEDIDGSQYMELGESKYVIVPSDVSFTANVKGEALGLYSLTVDLVGNNTQSHVHRYLGASTTPTMQASFTFANNTFSNIVTDLNGDNVTDVTATLDGQIIPPPVPYSYALLKTSIKALKLQRLLEAVLIVQVDIASYWDALLPRKPQYQKLENGALDTLKTTLKIYKQKKLITQEKFALLEVIINYLRN